MKIDTLTDRDGNLCVKCERPFEGLRVDSCPSCRDGALEFVNLGVGMFGADSPKMGEGRRYIVVKVEHQFNVHIGISPVYRNGRPCPFHTLHEAKDWCRRFERDVEVDVEG